MTLTLTAGQRATITDAFNGATIEIAHHYDNVKAWPAADTPGANRCVVIRPDGKIIRQWEL